jgi:ketosteroid isomerase-like protein
MSPERISDIVRRYFGAYRTKDRKLVEDLLAGDFTFTSPYDDAIDRTEYFIRCWPSSGRIRTHDIEKIFAQGDETFVLYRCITNDGKEFRNTEFFTFEGDRISRIAVYFGASYKGASYKNGAFVKEE